MSDPGVEPLEILEILELETPPYPRPPCRCPPLSVGQMMVGVMSFHKIYDLIG